MTPIYNRLDKVLMKDFRSYILDIKAKLEKNKPLMVEPAIADRLVSDLDKVIKSTQHFDDSQSLAFVYDGTLDYPADLLAACDYFLLNPDHSTVVFKRDIQTTQDPVVIASSMKAFYEREQDDKDEQ